MAALGKLYPFAHSTSLAYLGPTHPPIQRINQRLCENRLTHHSKFQQFGLKTDTISPGLQLQPNTYQM